MLFQHTVKSRLTLSVLAFFSLSNVFAQNQMQTKSVSSQTIAYASFKNDVNVYEVVQYQPEFEGGLSAFFTYLDTHVKTPPEAEKERADGRAFLSFVVNVDGSISNVTVRRTAYFKRLDDGRTVELDAEKDKALIDALNKEAIRVIMAMPKWKPGKQGAQAVRSTFSMPINFK